MNVVPLPRRPAQDPQVRAADPRATVFVSANAGSGKTSTLVSRVARLLLHGVPPDAVLCVTYTKAAAAEMQRRLFDSLGGWSIMDNEALSADLARIGEGQENLVRDLSVARTLFARALETPGGLKIQTLHGFCEKLLRRFPLEAGVSPGFSVLEDAAASEVSSRARDELAMAAIEDGEGPIGRAYARLAVELDYRAFEGLFTAFATQRGAIAAYAAACAESGGDIRSDVWRTCGFAEPTDPDVIEEQAVVACDWLEWRHAIAALNATGSRADSALAAKLAAVAKTERDTESQDPSFSDCLAVFTTQAGDLAKALGTKDVVAKARTWLVDEQERLHRAGCTAKAARMAENTVHALTLATAYNALYEGEKTARGALDFADLIARTQALLTEKADAAWVLYKLDGGIDHILVDEAQDTAPEQWDILRALTGDFFAGAGGRSQPQTAGRAAPIDRTLFVVGDEKQSIFGFQGARPERLQQEASYYSAAVLASGRRFEATPLLESWRSTPEILSFVDAVFADPDARAAARPSAEQDRVHHIAKRRHDGGSVDLWPLFVDEPADEPAAWDAPVDTPSGQSARKQLARRIAEEVAAQIAGPYGVFDKQTRKPRPATAGDVLILVRRRDGLFEEIIRALKQAHVPVAGADRLRLSDHVAFQDLLSLGRFALYPPDDLNLAELLRSPLCSVGEDDLYNLAQPRLRGDSLWAALNARGDERPVWTDARLLLRWAREHGRTRTPFDFFAGVLSRLDGEGLSMRQRLLTRLGRESEDAIDEFLAQTLAAENRGLYDLESFVAAMERSDIEIKRELEGPRSQVRVMTVHGAKGLEAPIVILPDTTSRPPPIRGGLLPTPEGGFLFAPRRADDIAASAAARRLIADQAEAESIRLLYVALTRARDRLIICGRISARDKAAAQGSWYARLEAAFFAPSIAERTYQISSSVGATQRHATRFGVDPPQATAPSNSLSSTPILPAWVDEPAPAELTAKRYATPSTVYEQDRGPATSPLSRQGYDGVASLGRFRRGDLIHRLLQALPDLAPSERVQGAARLLAKERDLSPLQRREIASAALAVLEDSRFEAVFGPGSRAEAAIAGSAPDLPPGLNVSGRIDRMVVTPARVLVVDFKTNRPSPRSVEQTDPAYLLQMALYAAVLRAVFPNRLVEAALIWTDGPKLMPIPENIMHASLATLHAKA